MHSISSIDILSTSLNPIVKKNSALIFSQLLPESFLCSPFTCSGEKEYSCQQKSASFNSFFRWFSLGWLKRVTVTRHFYPFTLFTLLFLVTSNKLDKNKFILWKPFVRFETLKKRISDPNKYQELFVWSADPSLVVAMQSDLFGRLKNESFDSNFLLILVQDRIMDFQLAAIYLTDIRQTANILWVIECVNSRMAIAHEWSRNLIVRRCDAPEHLRCRAGKYWLCLAWRWTYAVKSATWASPRFGSAAA